MLGIHFRGCKPSLGCLTDQSEQRFSQWNSYDGSSSGTQIPYIYLDGNTLNVEHLTCAKNALFIVVSLIFLLFNRGNV